MFYLMTAHCSGFAGFRRHQQLLMEERRQRQMMQASSVVLVERHVLTEEEHHDQDVDISFDVGVVVEDACRAHHGEEECPF